MTQTDEQITDLLKLDDFFDHVLHRSDHNALPYDPDKPREWVRACVMEFVGKERKKRDAKALTMIVGDDWFSESRYVCMCVCMQVCICVYVCVLSYIYIYIYIYTYSCVHTCSDEDSATTSLEQSSQHDGGSVFGGIHIHTHICMCMCPLNIGVLCVSEWICICITHQHTCICVFCVLIYIYCFSE